MSTPNEMPDRQDAPVLDLLIRNTRLLDSDDPVDIAIKDRFITAMSPQVDRPSAHVIDAQGGLSTPSFAEPHFHLDKVLSRRLLGAFSFSEAFARAREVKKQFTAADVEARASEVLNLAVARMRAHVDVDFATGTVSMEGVLAARERYGSVIDIQVIAFPQEGIVADPQAPALVRESIAMGAEFIGGLPEVEASVDDQRRHVSTLFDIAEETGVSLDFHADFTDSPS